MLVEESRMLQVSIFNTLQNNLVNIDYSVLLVGVMTIADEIDFQLSQAIESYTAETLHAATVPAVAGQKSVRLAPRDIGDPGGAMSGENEASFHFLAENSIDIICRAGLDMVLHYVSPSSFHVLGWQPEEMTGKRPDAFFLPEDASALAGNSLAIVRMRMKDGMRAWVEIKHRMVCDSSPPSPGKISSSSGTSRSAKPWKKDFPYWS